MQCQEDHIQQLVERLEIWYSQKEKDRPISFFLVGASGVGKTFTAKLLAQALQPYGYEYSYLAMTEFSQESSANNLTGSAMGYVGSEDKPKLFADLDRSNRLVILFDEIEKAHSTVFKTLMQLLDEGSLPWSKGTGDFRECVVMFISNIQMDDMIGIKYAFHQTGRSILGTEFQEAIKQMTAGSSSGARAVRNHVETLLSQPILRFRKQHARADTLSIDATDAGIQILSGNDDKNASSLPDMFRQAIDLLSEYRQRANRLPHSMNSIGKRVKP